MATITKLQEKIEGLENEHEEYVGRPEFDRHVSRTEKLLEGINKGLADNFDKLNGRIDKLFLREKD